MAFKDIAPTMSDAGVSKTDVNKVTVETPGASTGLPELSKEIVLAVIAEFANIEEANGYLSIAQKCGVTTAQVKTLHQEFNAVKASDVVVEEEEETVAK